MRLRKKLAAPVRVSKQAMHENVTLVKVRELRTLTEDGKVGMCIGCGSVQEGMAVDAAGWPCDECGAQAGVYAVEPLLLMCEMEPRRSK